LSVGDQTRAMEEGLTEQRAALVTTAHGMRSDQETYAAQAETLRAQLGEIITSARQGAAEIGETATQGAEILRQMIAASGEQLRALAEHAAAERDQVTADATQSLDAVAGVAARERDALEQRTREVMAVLAASAEEARRIAEGHLQSARDRLDQLGEATFAAGQQADAAFQSRLAEAKGVIEQSARLVDDAGAQIEARLKQGVEAARGAIVALEGVLAEVDEKLAKAPEEAHARTEAIRQNVERSIAALMESARKASEETQDIDAAFQERVRQNYDMLSEAVRLMGVVAGTAGPAAVRSAARRAESSLDPTTDRPRLRLTPTADDQALKTVFEPPASREPEPAPEGWTWKDILSSMDETAPGESAALAESIIGEIEAMGIDPGALVPRSRLEEIARAVSAGAPNAGREVVRRLAPAAIRRLGRRALTDPRFRAQAERYVRRYEGLIADAAGRQGEEHLAGALLGSDQGRAYLLLDAALDEQG
jgi:hypothetical protein